MLNPLLSLSAGSRLALSGVLAAACLLADGARGGDSLSLYVDQSLKPDATALAAFDLCVLNVDAQVDLEAGHTLGNKYLARVDLLHVAADSDAEGVALTLGVPLESSHEPRVHRLDATHAEWPVLVVHGLVESAAEKGFDGFVLAGLDAIRAGGERDALIETIAALDARFPDKQILIEGASDLLPEVRRWVDGFLMMGVTAQAEAGEMLPKNSEDVVRIEEGIREVRRQGLPAYAVDFAEPGEAEVIEAKTQRLQRLGAIPFITTASLSGVNLGPLREITRRVAVLHIGPAAQTWSALVVHGPLEWLGCRVEYIDAESDSAIPPLLEETAFVGVVFDPSLHLAQGLEAELKALVNHLTEKETPILMAGLSMEKPKAWESAGTVLRLNEAHSPAGIAGGSAKDPVPVLESWLGGGGISPVADTTTLNGRRILISHVTGEGFGATSSVRGLQTAAEVMRDRILRRYAMPITVAVCEGDVRGWTLGSDPRDAMRYEQIARSIFALPHVEAASNSFSRPLQWQAGEFIGGALNDGATDGRRGMEREIAGSMSYIHRNLLPAGKKVELMLWPANAAPSAAALAHSREVGAENLAEPEIGQPVAMSPLGPRTRHVGEEVQMIAASPARAQAQLDAAAMIAALARTDAGRRLSPVHVPLSFLDARDEMSVAAVEQVLDWCASQPLHAVSAASHARIVRDAAATRILQQAPGHWVIVNAGHARTLRLPVSAGVPDMARSRGIAGFSEHGGQCYIHTLGLRRVELVMQARSEGGQLRLAEASAQVEFFNMAARRALMQVSGHRPVELRFAGVQPGATCMVSANGEPLAAMADARGQVEFTVAPHAVIQLQVMPSNYAAMR